MRAIPFLLLVSLTGRWKADADEHNWIWDQFICFSQWFGVLIIRLAFKRYMSMYYVMDNVCVQGSGIKMISPAVGRLKKWNPLHIGLKMTLDGLRSNLNGPLTCRIAIELIWGLVKTKRCRAWEEAPLRLNTPDLAALKKLDIPRGFRSKYVDWRVFLGKLLESWSKSELWNSLGMAKLGCCALGYLFCAVQTSAMSVDDLN